MFDREWAENKAREMLDGGTSSCNVDEFYNTWCAACFGGHIAIRQDSLIIDVYKKWVIVVSEGVSMIAQVDKTSPNMILYTADIYKNYLIRADSVTEMAAISRRFIPICGLPRAMVDGYDYVMHWLKGIVIRKKGILYIINADKTVIYADSRKITISESKVQIELYRGRERIEATKRSVKYTGRGYQSGSPDYGIVLANLTFDELKEMTLPKFLG